MCVKKRFFFLCLLMAFSVGSTGNEDGLKAAGGELFMMLSELSTLIFCYESHEDRKTAVNNLRNRPQSFVMKI